MPVGKEKFILARKEAAEKELVAGEWGVYADYEVREAGEGNAYVVGASGAVPEREHLPLVDHETLFLDFARLGDGGSITREAWFDWTKEYGVLGLERDEPVRYLIRRHRELGNGLDELSRELDRMDDGGWDWDLSRYPAFSGGPRESYRNFVEESTKARRLLQLYEAATHPDGPDVRVIKWYFDREGLGGWTGTAGFAKKWALNWVGYVVQETLAVHCYPALYSAGNKLSQGWGFHTLLGAMYLQMSWLLTSTEQVRCKWCGDVITFKQPELPLERLGEKGFRKEYKTRVDRDFCVQKNGVEDKCCDAWYYQNVTKPRREARKLS